MTLTREGDGTAALNILRPGGSKRKIGYNAAGQTTTIEEFNPNGGHIDYFKLSYDSGGRIGNEFTAPLTAAFTEPSQTMTANADNQIATFNGQTVVHDADGNMTTGPLNSSTLVNYTYDSRNRLTGVAGVGGVTYGYGYDPDGNRLTLTQNGLITRFVVNPAATLSQVLVRTRPSGSKTYCMYGAGLLYDVEVSSSGTETGERHVYHYDYRGSTVAISSQIGLVLERIEYSVYGQITRRTGSWVDTPFLFNGKYGVMTDPNSLYCMRARYYNPYLKRFINADPIGLSGSMNFYAYADGNPISLIDPFGLWAGVDDAIALGGGALIGLAAQGIGDLIRGQASSWQHYVAAAVGGAAAGEATLYTGPAGGLVARAAVGGAVGGLIGNTTRQALDITTGNQTSYSYSSAVTETALGGALGAGGGYVGSRVVPGALSYLSNGAKGNIGEGLSLVDNMMQGRVPVGFQERVPLPGTFTRVDWQFRSVTDWSTLINVEAKFGAPSGTLNPNLTLFELFRPMSTYVDFIFRPPCNSELTFLTNFR